LRFREDDGRRTDRHKAQQRRLSMNLGSLESLN
jgi:hypothetical protein